MITMLTILYCGLIYLLFYRFKLVKPSTKSWTAAAIVGILVIGWILLANNLYQPYSKQAVVSQYVVQVAPQVSGEVVEVAVSTNAPVSAGDVLFRIDPRSFQATVDQLEAALESMVNGENTVVAQAQAQLLEARASESKAQLALASVTNLQLREGFIVRSAAPVMTFVDTSEQYLIVSLSQNTVRHVEPGNTVEVALRLYPGRIFKGTVESVAWASGEGQEDPSGNLPSVASLVAWHGWGIKRTDGILRARGYR